MLHSPIHCAAHVCLIFILLTFPIAGAKAQPSSATNTLPPRSDSSAKPSQYTARTWQDGLPNDVVHAIAQTSDGYLWIGTRHGLARFNGHSFEVFDAKEAFPLSKDDSITALCAGVEGDLWIGSNTRDVAQLKGGQFYRHRISEEPVAVRSLLQCSDKSIWVGTTRGVFRQQNGKWASPSDELTNVVARALLEDKQGNIWITTTCGVIQWRSGIAKIHAEKDDRKKKTF